jgi:uncharacterized protein (TIGR02118 family)
MFTVMTVLRKKPDVTTEAFRHFMEFDYGPVYASLPETRSYIHYYVTDAQNDGSEDPIDAIVHISFDSAEAMKAALDNDRYRAARVLREAFIRTETAGIHALVVNRVVKLV